MLCAYIIFYSSTFSVPCCHGLELCAFWCWNNIYTSFASRRDTLIEIVNIRNRIADYSQGTHELFVFPCDWICVDWQLIKLGLWFSISKLVIMWFLSSFSQNIMSLSYFDIASGYTRWRKASWNGLILKMRR